MSTEQMSPRSISSLYHAEAISVNYTAHNASHQDQLLNDTFLIMDGLVKVKWEERKKKKEKSGEGAGVRLWVKEKVRKVQYDRKQMNRELRFEIRKIYILFQPSAQFNKNCPL